MSQTEQPRRNRWSLPPMERVRGVASQLTTPLHPDDYLCLVNPLWSARELRGRVEKVIPETESAATLVIRPGWGYRFDHQPGQYISIGVQVNGRFHWRSYSLTSPAQRGRRTITITVKAMPEGFLSEHLVRGLAPGTIVRLARPAGDFVLPDPPPARMLFLTGGSGVTPVMAMLRTLQRRDTLPDVVMVNSARTPRDMLFRAELDGLAQTSTAFTLHNRFTDTDGVFGLDELDTVVSDWRSRETWACGPGPMLDACEEHWATYGRRDRLHLERFNLALADGGGEGGTVTFTRSGQVVFRVEADGATPLLDVGEHAGLSLPFGCRMGICHTCTVPLTSGAVRDLRDGSTKDQQNEYVQTCVSVAAGDCELAV